MRRAISACRRLATAARAPLAASIAVSVCVLSTGCATLQQLAALRPVDFSLDRVSNVRLAGIDVAAIDSFDDIGLVDAARLAAAVTRSDLPLEMRLHILAENPADNPTEARLVRLDWTLLLQDRATVSGVFADEVLLPPGEPRDVPVVVTLNLVEFFEGSAQDLVELVLSVTGQGGEPKEVTLRATPVVETPLGPIRYPQPITILSRTVGN